MSRGRCTCVMFHWSDVDVEGAMYVCYVSLQRR